MLADQADTKTAAVHFPSLPHAAFFGPSSSRLAVASVGALVRALVEALVGALGKHWRVAFAADCMQALKRFPKLDEKHALAIRLEASGHMMPAHHKRTAGPKVQS